MIGRRTDERSARGIFDVHRINATLRRYTAAQNLIQLLRNWWTLTWLTLGMLAVVAGIVADKVRGEPAILALCVTMILIAQPSARVRVLTGALGAVGALLAIAQGQFGLIDRGLWLQLAFLVGGSATIALVSMVFWRLTRNDQTPQSVAEDQRDVVEE